MSQSKISIRLPSRRHLGVFALLASTLASLAMMSSCARSNLFSEKGRDNYFGGHGGGGNNKHYVPREVQRVESIAPLFGQR